MEDAVDRRLWILLLFQNLTKLVSCQRTGLGAGVLICSCVSYVCENSSWILKCDNILMKYILSTYWKLQSRSEEKINCQNVLQQFFNDSKRQEEQLETVLAAAACECFRVQLEGRSCTPGPGSVRLCLQTAGKVGTRRIHSGVLYTSGGSSLLLLHARPATGRASCLFVGVADTSTQGMFLLPPVN